MVESEQVTPVEATEAPKASLPSLQRELGERQFLVMKLNAEIVEIAKAIDQLMTPEAGA